MNNIFDRKRDSEICEIIAVIRVLFILLIFTSVYSMLPQDLFSLPLEVIIITAFVLIVFVAIYLSWGYFIKTSVQTLEISRKDIIYQVIYVAVLTLIIFFTGAHESQYKNIYFLVIIADSMRHGSKMGILSSVLSTVGIMFNDMVYNASESINIYLQADLVIIVSFFVIGWMLGKYVENEIEHRKKLSEKVVTDEVTGLYNHRYFQERLHTDIETAQAEKGKVALIMIDLDYFKYYNDTYGHQQGDTLLREVGEAIKSCIKNSGTVCRYGGDEFAVILYNKTVEETAQIGERIRMAIDGANFFEKENQPSSEVTASLGIALYPDNASDKDELIKKADDAMYKAKYMSKNKVEIYFSVLDDLKQLLNESERDLLNSMRTLITVINAKDRYTYGHSERVVSYATMIGQAMGLDEIELRQLRYGAYLHDIGKIEISREVLNKETQLTHEEWRILKSHPEWGAEIIKPINALKDSIPAVLYHHERFDGWGYPEGLSGKNIPLLARILSVADSYDAMTTKRPYKVSKSFEEAIEELEKSKGTQLDPDIVDIFVSLLLNNKNEIA
ncbi:cyclic di-GMP phosphodiesterase response regulator RpfG [Oxobacter pfennigii]|uniref:Cyclic di-GMP phosphodiesterase response regulator RpfG n=1 Tax=Oxobacter pfennigii TaxID=36849 RepID=A0A0P8X164_9CLOT|nr:diguanylate cyclase [Oxobacter pfennigii]KPU44539.1 cyclic di-GMP phosphodiesterase response regulator RpfG [Oxobacter pfennigii]